MTQQNLGTSLFEKEGKSDVVAFLTVAGTSSSALKLSIPYTTAATLASAGRPLRLETKQRTEAASLTSIC